MDFAKCFKRFAKISLAYKIVMLTFNKLVYSCLPKAQCRSNPKLVIKKIPKPCRSMLGAVGMIAKPSFTIIGTSGTIPKPRFSLIGISGTIPNARFSLKGRSGIILNLKPNKHYAVRFNQ